MGVYFWQDVDVFATRGPCEPGFHVPLQTDRQGVYNAGVSLGAWSSGGGSNLKTYLKLPLAGRRDLSSGNTESQNSNGYYWAADIRDASSTPYNLSFSSSIYPSNYGSASYGFSIRPFKDYSVIPNSSWNVLYQGTGSAGIYHNSTLGLISISSDGTTRYTIVDKNLGATTVYNDGNTLSQANCGKYYQRGNNYGFAWTGSITTTSGTVDISSYGPGNYYSSSSFNTSNPYYISLNKNLRGGVDGNVPI